ncbi:MAG: 4Fe-4S binding protein [Synergistales bacterium]|nr:4Fe-4S binding protein [Synergistales bacterium]
MDRPKVVKYTPPECVEDYPLGAFQAGHLVQKNAGWRVFRPVIDHDKCIGCLRCFLVCPDGVIDKSGEKLEIDYDFCKGCGVCAYECKVNAIRMVKEGEEADE